MLDERDFFEACDRITYLDDWFPTIARLRFMADECRADRARERQARENIRPIAETVCAYCHGARWVRLGGYDPLQMQAGDEGSRVRPCPRCTTDRRHDVLKERRMIADEGGVPNPEPPREVDMRHVTWPRQMDALRNPATGRVDMDRLYRLSREMRGLDPDIDDRPAPVAGFRTAGQPAPNPEPRPRLSAARAAATGADPWNDEIPF